MFERAGELPQPRQRFSPLGFPDDLLDMVVDLVVVVQKSRVVRLRSRW